MSNYSLPKTAIRFTVPQYCEWDPVELAVDIRDANESARALVRLLMDEVERLRGEVERLDCRVKELSTAPACGGERKRKEWIEPPIYNAQGLRIKCYDCGAPMAVHPTDKSWSCTGSCG